MRLPTSTESLLRAIQAERRKARLRRYEGTLYHVQPIQMFGHPAPTYALLYLQEASRASGSPTELDERFEGGVAVVESPKGFLPVRANAAPYPSGAHQKRQNNRYPIVEVIENRLEILVELQEQPLPAANQRVTLYEPDFLEALEKWVRDLLPNPVFIELQEAGGNYAESVSRELTLPAPSPIRLLWGPPGTGKTYTLGERLAEAWQKGERCCAVAPSHVAADQLALATGAALERRGWDPQPGVVLRFGQRMLSAQSKLPRHLTMDTDDLAALREQAADLRRSLRMLQVFLRDERTPQHQREQTFLAIASIHEQLSAIQSKIHESEATLVANAKIVIATSHAFAIHSAIHARKEDQKFADESSMLQMAFVARFLHSLPRSATFGGDFLQLPPIVQAQEDADARRWFGTDIFASFGLPNARVAERLQSEGILEMLTEQRRMRPEICDYISAAFYGGRLTTVGEHPFDPLLEGWPTDAFVWVDPSLVTIPGTLPNPTSAKGYSWDLSAHLTAAWARAATHVLRNAQVAAMTPWRNQEGVLRRLLGQEIHQESVKVGTVHKLQGQEADIVVFDVVNATHGPLKHQPERILNVAVSRARKQVIVVATAKMLRSHSLLSAMPLPDQPLAWPPASWSEGGSGRTLPVP